MISLILISLGISSSQASSSASSHASIAPTTYVDTYWHYRANLMKGFVRVGDGAGGCLIADSRNTTTNTITFADSTSNQGWYFSVLATELFLLRENRKDTSGTLKEIACALKAMSRLGLSIDGYFIRDDVDTAAGKRFPGIQNVVSDFTNENPKKKQMSQDQVLDLMMGYRFLALYLNEEDQVDQMNLKKEVKRQVRTMLQYVRGKPIWHSWVIYGKDGMKVERGPDAKFYSKAFKKIGDEILGRKGNRGVRSYFISGAVFWFFKLTIDPLQFYSKTMVLELASTSGVWGRSAERILKRYDLKYHAEVFRLINAVIYRRHIRENEGGNKRQGFHDKIEGYLNLAPYAGITGDEMPVWGQPNRYYADDRIRSHQYGPTDNPPALTDEMPGTDFMLLHNLFLIYYKPAVAKTFAPTQEYKDAFQQSCGY